jgi:hypothetical protein
VAGPFLRSPCRCLCAVWLPKGPRHVILHYCQPLPRKACHIGEHATVPGRRTVYACLLMMILPAHGLLVAPGEQHCERGVGADGGLGEVCAPGQADWRCASRTPCVSISRSSWRVVVGSHRCFDVTIADTKCPLKDDGKFL